MSAPTAGAAGALLVLVIALGGCGDGLFTAPSPAPDGPAHHEHDSGWNRTSGDHDDGTHEDGGCDGGTHDEGGCTGH